MALTWCTGEFSKTWLAAAGALCLVGAVACLEPRAQVGDDAGVIEPPSGLAYANNPAIYTVGSAIAPSRPSSSGGAVASFSVSPALPQGLELDASTGAISGTPTSIARLASYAVTAANAGGSTSANVSITVNDVAPSGLAYETSPAVYTVGAVIPVNHPSSSGGAVVSYSVSPALPAGLRLEASSGAIAGTPSAVTATASHTVTATNTGGSSTGSITLTVNDAAPTGLTYETNPAVYVIDVPITPNRPSSGGGAVVSYSVSPALPPGLGLSPTTGTISGTPTAPASPTSFTVTAINTGGSTQAAVSLTVILPPPPVISVQPANQVAPAGNSATFSVTAQGAGALGYQWSKNGAPIAGAMASTYTTPATVLADKGAVFAVTVTDPYGQSAVSAGATLSVNAFVATGAMHVARAGHTATLLPNGKVLVVGGAPLVSAATAELFDPATGAFTYTGTMGTPRAGHTATLLPNGKVFIAGGTSTGATGNVLSSTEMYDPSTGLFTSAAPMSTERQDFTATLLKNGKVLLAGGLNWYFDGIPTADLYDPASGAFAVSPPTMVQGRWGHGAVLMANGKVLLAGGHGVANAELYDPAANTFTAAGSMSNGNLWFRMALLSNGKVLVPAVIDQNGSELFDPATGTFSTTGKMVAARPIATATTLASGKVLVAGGSGSAGYLQSAELYDPATGAFTSTADLTTPRAFHTATLLPNGKVLIVGGNSAAGTHLATAELYE